MAQLNHLVFLTLLIVEFVCLTIASHPTAWRRHAEARTLNTMSETPESEEIPADNSQEIPSDGTESAQSTSSSESTTASACPRRWMQDQQKQFRIDSIKRHILEKLKLKHAPNISGPPPKNPALRMMLNNYPQLQHNPAMQSDSPRTEVIDPSPANLERILIFAKRPLQTYGTNPSDCCYFNVADKTTGYHVSSAKLYFYVAPAKVIQNTLHQLSIKMILAPPTGYSGHTKLRTVANIKIQLSLGTGEWRSVDFTNVVQGWAGEPETNLGIVMELRDDADNQVIVTETSPEESRRPFLQLRLEDARRRRTKRQADQMCSEDEQDRECCLYPLNVDFEQIGWDWIIAPKQYTANYCFGSCPNHYLYQYPHTQLVSTVQRMAVAGPCCSPSQMSSISLLMFDDEYDIIFAELPDMAVEQCNCS